MYNNLTYCQLELHFHSLTCTVMAHAYFMHSPHNQIFVFVFTCVYNQPLMRHSTWTYYWECIHWNKGRL